MIDSILVEPEDWVGTFNCTKWDADSTACEKLGPCVGSRKWNTAKCGSGVCDLRAMDRKFVQGTTTLIRLLCGDFWQHRRNFTFRVTLRVWTEPGRVVFCRVCVVIAGD